MRKFLVAAAFLLISNYGKAQHPEFQFSFFQVFDNREYFSDYGFSQTIFASRLDASAVFRLDSLQFFAAGLNYMYEFGSTPLGVPPQVNLYYRYETSRSSILLGSFPRKDLIRMPLVFLNDTLNYYRPNIEGAYLAHKGEILDIYGFIDWTGRVAENRRETFLVGMQSELKFSSFYISPAFLMYHNARSYSPVDSVPLQDNGIMSLVAGYRTGDVTGIYIHASAGIVASYNRHRPENFTWGKGLLADVDLQHKIFGMKAVYYRGNSIDFTYGDPFYRSRNYGRLDLFIDPAKSRKVETKIGWSFHLVPGEGIHHSQKVLLRVRF